MSKSRTLGAAIAFAVLTTAAPCGASTAVRYSQRPGHAKGDKCWAKSVIQAVQLIAYAMKKNIAIRESGAMLTRSRSLLSLGRLIEITTL